MRKIVLTMFVLLPTVAFADVKSGKIGANFQYGGSLNSLGMWIHIADFLAISPFVGYAANTVVAKNSFYTGLGCGATDCTVTTKRNDWIIGLEIPIYLAKFNALNFFASPLISYGFNNGTTKGENATNGRTGENDNASGTLLSFGIYAGLQIPLLDQLHVFGKGGVEYSISSTTPVPNTTSSYNDKVYSFGSGRYSIGAIFYFN